MRDPPCTSPCEKIAWELHSPRKEPRHWLDYATVVFIGLSFLTTSIAAGFVGWQASIARDTEIRQLRPYIHIVPGTWSSTEKPDGSVTIEATPKIRVFGQTPAGGINPQWEIILYDYPMPESYAIPSYIQTHSRSDVTA